VVFNNEQRKIATARARMLWNHPSSGGLGEDIDSPLPLEKR